MDYPILKTIPARYETLDVFGGYNGSPRVAEGEFADMKNMTSDHFPILAPRVMRGFYRKPASPQGIIAKEKLCYVDGSDFVAGDEVVPMGLSVEAADCPKQLVSMGAYVIILPDKKYVNTKNTADFGDIQATFTAASPVSFTLCSDTGATLGAAVSPAAPENPQNLDYWIDTSAIPHTLRQYSAAQQQWTAVQSAYIRMDAAGIGEPFSVFDGVQISGIKDENLQKTLENAVIQAKGKDFIVLSGLLSETFTQEPQEGIITVSRPMPTMDFMVEAGNRLWGCRYGEDRGGKFVNELYCCKLGDFRNWNCFQGLSTDSYRASCGTDGPFTGAVSYLGMPLFFKENCVHKVYGSYPAAFRIQHTACRGVQPGCHKSLAVVGETLFYRARSGICAYDGALPVDISQNLGSFPCAAAVAGSVGNKYYISMESPEGIWQLFVYDAAKNLWHKEDDLRADGFAALGGELYCIDGKKRNIITMLGSHQPDSEPVRWIAQTGRIGAKDGGRTYLSRIDARLQLEKGARAEIYARYDSCGPWEHLCTVFSKGLGSISVPIRLRRCDHLELRIQGEGMMKLHSLTKKLQQGSEKP